MDQALMLKNATSLIKAAKAFVIPVVHSTVNAATDDVGPTIPEIAELLRDDEPLDRTTINSWEDLDFGSSAIGFA